MKSKNLICGDDSDEEFQELRAMIVRLRGNKNAMAEELGVSRAHVKNRLQEYGLHKECVQEALSSKLRFRLPVD